MLQNEAKNIHIIYHFLSSYYMLSIVLNVFTWITSFNPHSNPQGDTIIDIISYEEKHGLEKLTYWSDIL